MELKIAIDVFLQKCLIFWNKKNRIKKIIKRKTYLVFGRILFKYIQQQNNNYNQAKHCLWNLCVLMARKSALRPHVFMVIKSVIIHYSLKGEPVFAEPWIWAKVEKATFDQT